MRKSIGLSVGVAVVVAMGWRLLGVPESYVVVNGKLSESADIFDAIVSRKKLAIGFYDGTTLPIDLVGLDPKPFIACVGQRLGLNEP